MFVVYLNFILIYLLYKKIVTFFCKLLPQKLIFPTPRSRKNRRANKNILCLPSQFTAHKNLQLFFNTAYYL